MLDQPAYVSQSRGHTCLRLLDAACYKYCSLFCKTMGAHSSSVPWPLLTSHHFYKLELWLLQEGRMYIWEASRNASTVRSSSYRSRNTCTSRPTPAQQMQDLLTILLWPNPTLWLLSSDGIPWAQIFCIQFGDYLTIFSIQILFWTVYWANWPLSVHTRIVKAWYSRLIGFF